MDRIISEELLIAVIDELSQHRESNVLDALMDNLRNAPQTDRPVVSREAIGEAFRKNHQCGNRDDLGLDAIYALQLPTPKPVAGQPTELVMGGPESRYHPPIIGTAGQVGEDELLAGFREWNEGKYTAEEKNFAKQVEKRLDFHCAEIGAMAFYSGAQFALRKPVETVGNYAEIVARWDAEEHLALSARQKDKLVNALRTQPQAPVCPACGGTWEDDKNGACDNEFHCHHNKPQAPVVEVPSVVTWKLIDRDRYQCQGCGDNYPSSLLDWAPAHCPGCGKEIGVFDDALLQRTARR